MQKHALGRFLTHSLVFTAALVLTCSVMADATVWVRIHHEATHPAVQAAARMAPLHDYGGFQWGAMPESMARNLERDNLRISILDNPFELVLGGKRFDPADRFEREPAYLAAPGGDWHLIQFDGPIRAEWLRALDLSGVEVVQALHPFSYLVWADSPRINAARALSHVRFAGAMQPEWKQPSSRSVSPGSNTRTMALISAHADLDDVQHRLEQLGEVHTLAPYNRHFRIAYMDVAPDHYQQISEIPAIYTIQQVLPEAGLRGEMSNQSITGGIDGNGTIVPGYDSWLESTQFDGNGILVGVVDGGIRESHQDLIGNTAPCVASGESPTSCTTANSNHGTHVAGAIAGHADSGTTDSDGFLRGQGIAPGAQVIQQRFEDFLDSNDADNGFMQPDGMLKIFRESALSGALLTNNSWGPTGSPQGYDIPTQQVDFIARDANPSAPGHQPVLPVWAIMNGAGDSNGQCAPSSLGSPDEAKNLLAVGSTSLQSSIGAQLPNIFRISGNSAHGPACDGRRVPHIVAPGCRTDSLSGSSNSAYGLACGTSMAAPMVAGGVAVWAEKYLAEHGINPSPALTKSVFTAAAHDLAGNPNADGVIMNHRPDRFQGYGRVDLDFVMNPGLEVFTFDQSHVFNQSGQDWQLELAADEANEPIRIMLAWTDAPGHGLGGETPAWVNNLDLVVETDSDSYLGNVIGDDGWSETGGESDIRNNLEAVYLSPTQHNGNITLKVIASDIAGDALEPWNPAMASQDFALVCYNCVPAESTFTLDVEPDRLEACIPPTDSTQVETTIEIGAIGTPDDPVELTSAGEPDGVTSAINPVSVSAPAQATWSLTIEPQAQAGQSTATLMADDATKARQRSLLLTLHAPPEFPGLQEPLDGELDVDLLPLFAWQPVPDALEYRVQIAADAEFTQMVVDEVLATDNFLPDAPLESNSDHYWRVQGINDCGSGQWSEIAAFTTLADAKIELSTEAMQLTLQEGGSDSKVLEIGNLGTDPLDWIVMTDEPEGTENSAMLSACADSLPQPAWIETSPQQGMVDAGDSQTVEVLFNAGDLAQGEYLTWICFESNDVETPVVSLEVVLTVSALFSDRFEE